MTFGQVTIHVSAKLTDDFKKKAKESFPKETFAYLLGRLTDDKIHIEQLFFPVDVNQFCNHNTVNVQNHWAKEARREAKHQELVIIGDIHSHPFKNKQTKIYSMDAAPGEADWEALEDGHIMGICLVAELKNGNLRARTKFWGPIPQVKVKQTK